MDKNQLKIFFQTNFEFEKKFDFGSIEAIPESTININNSEPDSDGDGLTDEEEINTWNTDPLNRDTDGDGFLDGEEVKNGYDPLVAERLLSDRKLNTSIQTGTPAVISDCTFLKTNDLVSDSFGYELKETLHYYQCPNNFQIVVDILTADATGIAEPKELISKRINSINQNSFSKVEQYEPLVYDIQREFTWLYNNSIYIVKMVPKPQQGIGVKEVEYLYAVTDYYSNKYPPTEALEI